MKRIVYIVSICSMLMTAPALAMGGGSSVGPASPATMNCLKLGGGIESVQDDQGNGVANCLIEDWALYEAMDKRGLIPHQGQDGDKPGMPNPAALNCVRVGGGVRSLQTHQGSLSLCVVEEWTLLRSVDITQE